MYFIVSDRNTSIKVIGTDLNVNTSDDESTLNDFIRRGVNKVAKGNQYFFPLVNEIVLIEKITIKNIKWYFDQVGSKAFWDGLTFYAFRSFTVSWETVKYTPNFDYYSITRLLPLRLRSMAGKLPKRSGCQKDEIKLNLKTLGLVIVHSTLKFPEKENGKLFM